MTFKKCFKSIYSFTGHPETATKSGNLGFEKLHFTIILNAYLKKKKDFGAGRFWFSRSL